MTVRTVRFSGSTFILKAAFVASVILTCIFAAI